MRPLRLAGLRELQPRLARASLESATCRTGACQHHTVASCGGREKSTGGAGSPVVVGWADLARSGGRRPRDRVRAGCTCFDQTGGFCHCECPSAYVRGEAQQTQLAMSLVLHRIPGIGSPRDFIRFLRCQYLHLPVRSSGFERLFAHGLARTAIERPNSLELPPP